RAGGHGRRRRATGAPPGPRAPTGWRGESPAPPPAPPPAVGGGPPPMWGSDTVTTVVSRTSMKVASMTEKAMSHGLALGRHSRGAAAGGAGDGSAAGGVAMRSE